MSERTDIIEWLMEPIDERHEEYHSIRMMLELLNVQQLREMREKMARELQAAEEVEDVPHS